MTISARARAPRRPKPGPAAGVIWEKSRAKRASRKQGGGSLSNAFRVQLEIGREMAYDLDQRKVVEFVTVGMAEFFRKQLRLGLRPDAGRLPDAKSSKATRIKPQVGMHSGYMADHWWLGSIRGGSLKAVRDVKPYGGDGGPNPPGNVFPGRAHVITSLLKRTRGGGPVDFQSIRGAAGVELARLFSLAVGFSFATVRTPVTAKTRAGTLPEVRR